MSPQDSQKSVGLELHFLEIISGENGKEAQYWNWMEQSLREVTEGSVPPKESRGPENKLQEQRMSHSFGRKQFYK